LEVASLGDTLGATGSSFFLFSLFFREVTMPKGGRAWVGAIVAVVVVVAVVRTVAARRKGNGSIEDA
jgi:hypothetical protein